jgi:hypothetical protein
MLVKAARGEELEVPRQLQIGLGEDTGVAELELARQVEVPGDDGGALELVAVIARPDRPRGRVGGMIVEDRLDLVTGLLEEVVIEKGVL